MIVKRKTIDKNFLESSSEKLRIDKNGSETKYGLESIGMFGIQTWMIKNTEIENLYLDSR